MNERTLGIAQAPADLGGGLGSGRSAPSTPPATATPPPPEPVGPTRGSTGGGGTAEAAVIAEAAAALARLGEDGPMAALVRRGLIEVHPVPPDTVGIPVRFTPGTGADPTGYTAIDGHLRTGSSTTWLEQETAWVTSVAHTAEITDDVASLDKGLVVGVVRNSVAALAQRARDRQLIDVVVAALREPGAGTALPAWAEVVKPADGSAPQLTGLGPGDRAVLLVRAGCPDAWIERWKRRHPNLRIVRVDAPSEALDLLLCDLTLLRSVHGSIAVHRASDLTPAARMTGEGTARKLTVSITERRAIPLDGASDVTVTRMKLKDP